MTPIVRFVLMVVLATASVGTVLMARQWGTSEFLFDVSTWTYSVVPVLAGALLAIVAYSRRDKGHRGWILIGGGIFLWGLGEMSWTYYSAFLGVEVPYPGWADVFYVAAYPVIFAGTLMLPHMRPGRWQRIRLGLDALAGTVALSAIVWVLYLESALYLDPDAGLLENAVNLAYPAGDLILLIALMVLATRRSQLQFDGRLILLSVGMLVTAAADIAYVFQVEAGTYFEGGRLDAVWLAAYGLFALAVVLVAGPARVREQADRPNHLWPLVAPYSAIAVLFVMTVSETREQATVLQVTTALVALLIIVRQAVAIRETREIVEKQRNALVASISHELRTPLTAMSGFTEILHEDPDLDRDARLEMVEIINSQTNHLSRIVEDLVDVARDRLGATDLVLRSCDVAELVDGALEMLSSRDISVAVDKELESGLTVVADGDRLTQVLVNYLVNAGRYGHGQVNIRAFSNGKGETTIEVHDNGRGVSKKHEVTIWDRFERGDHTYLSSVQGSGLGLAIARQLITAHGGRTGHRQSESLGGACFWLTLPSAESVEFAAA